MRALRLFPVALALLLTAACSGSGYTFDGPVPEKVLTRYLGRAITMSEFLTPEPFIVDGTYPDKDADVRYILGTGTKFVGRAIYRWGHEDQLTDPAFWSGAADLAAKVHEADPDVIFQGAVFEAVYPEVNAVPVPEWAFEALGLPVEERNFRYGDMLFPDGTFVGQWGRGSVPDIRAVETQLWLMYLIGSYVDIGCEAIHLGQVYLMGRNDPQWETWDSFLTKVRRYVHPRARRHWVLFDCHGGRKGVIRDGRSLTDFNAYPLRIKEVEGEPLKGVLEEGWSDSIYGADIACKVPSGWHTDALPYLVEFDNFGVSDAPGRPSTDGYHIWGYDEITWFYLLSHEDKLSWLEYAWNWIRTHDPAGHLEMPGARVITTGEGPVFMGRAVAPSDSIPHGMDIEGKVTELFGR